MIILKNTLSQLFREQLIFSSKVLKHEKMLIFFIKSLRTKSQATSVWPIPAITLPLRHGHRRPSHPAEKNTLWAQLVRTGTAGYEKVTTRWKGLQRISSHKKESRHERKCFFFPCKGRKGKMSALLNRMYESSDEYGVVMKVI